MVNACRETRSAFIDGTVQGQGSAELGTAGAKALRSREPSAFEKQEGGRVLGVVSK